MKRAGLMECIVQWKLDTETESLDHFEVQFCTWKCENIWRERWDFEARIPMAYESSFKLRVIAVFNIPGMKQIRRLGGFRTVVPVRPDRASFSEIFTWSKEGTRLNSTGILHTLRAEFLTTRSSCATPSAGKACTGKFRHREELFGSQASFSAAINRFR